MSAEVWGRSSETQYDTIEVADVVRIDDACIVCRKPWPDEYGAVRVHVTCAIRWYWATLDDALGETMTRRPPGYSAATGRQADERRERDYRAGTLLPYPDRITTALDACGLYGPEVDLACLAVEPAVDDWEAGRAVPTWEQLCRARQPHGDDGRVLLRRADRHHAGLHL